MKKDSGIYVAGHNGMVGSAILRLLREKGYSNLLFKSRAELDLTCQAAVADFFQTARPEYVFLAAAKVGGIKANNSFPADFLYENLMIQCNVVRQAFLAGTRKLCFLGSSCIYPRECPQPIREESLLTGPLEPTNEGYAVAKIAGYKLCYYYAKQHGFNTVSLMPCNLYGRNDDFNLETCHVFSALTRRFVDAADSGAAEVAVWGTGSPKREFLNVDDLARAALMIMLSHESPDFINIGSGMEISIRDLASKIAAAAGFKGRISWDPSKPDGMPRKLMDDSKASSLGFKPQISIDEGVRLMIEEYRERKKGGRL